MGSGQDAAKTASGTTKGATAGLVGGMGILAGSWGAAVEGIGAIGVGSIGDIIRSGTGGGSVGGIAGNRGF
ncbi:hypothetical protein SDC9_189708 [bioreactor metagenome]|jgi:hypothetical protein|uniref:Uncharacterized protein n=1 Tax=bioreactor metagenome TaxID=1076179 RepID=A0A645HUK3_9ZZZZ